MTLTEVKEALPKPARRFLGKIRAVGRRVQIWWLVYRELSGVSAHDKAVLRRAIMSAPVDIFRELDRWRDPMVSQNCKIKAHGIGFFLCAPIQMTYITHYPAGRLQSLSLSRRASSQVMFLWMREQISVSTPFSPLASSLSTAKSSPSR